MTWVDPRMGVFSLPVLRLLYHSCVLGRYRFLGPVPSLKSAHLFVVGSWRGVHKKKAFPGGVQWLKPVTKREKRREIQDFFFNLKDLILRLLTNLLGTGYQLYVLEQKRGATYLFISKTMVVKPCPKKKPVTGGGVCPNTHERSNICNPLGYDMDGGLSTFGESTKSNNDQR